MEQVFVFYSFPGQGPADDQLLQKICEMPKNLQASILRYKMKQDRVLSFAGKKLLQYALLRANLPESYLHRISYTSYKRPWMDATVDFNISHTEDCAICVLGISTRVGIDVEIKKAITVEDILAVLRPDELKCMRKRDESPGAILEFWTKKEAVLKASGEGLMMQPQEVFFSKNERASYKSNTWFLKSLPFHHNYVCWLATDRAVDNIPVTGVDIWS